MRVNYTPPVVGGNNKGKPSAIIWVRGVDLDEGVRKAQGKALELGCTNPVLKNENYFDKADTVLGHFTHCFTDDPHIKKKYEDMRPDTTVHLLDPLTEEEIEQRTIVAKPAEEKPSVVAEVAEAMAKFSTTGGDSVNAELEAMKTKLAAAEKAAADAQKAKDAAEAALKKKSAA